MSRRPLARRGLILALSMMVVVGVPSAVSAGPADNHCVSPTGTDLNERWSVSEAIIAPYCLEIPAGEKWRVAQAWFMDLTYKKVPKGYVPAASTPFEDFLLKFEGVKLVVDPGTDDETTYEFTNVEDLGTAPAAGVVQSLTMGKLRALDAGVHVVDSYWLMSALHCDGFGHKIALNCLPAGYSLYDHFTFVVT